MNVQTIQGYANAYLVNGTVLIDAGIDPTHLAGRDFGSGGSSGSSGSIKSVGSTESLESIELIILTHCHFDHTCAASAIAAISGSEIAIHESDARLLGDDRATASVLFGRRAPQITPDILLYGGELFEFDDLLLEVLHTPGHTPGGICIYESGTKSLFSGDTIFPDGGIGRCDLGGDISDLIRSTELLTTLDVDTLYPGHFNASSVDVSSQIGLSSANARELEL